MDFVTENERGVVIDAFVQPRAAKDAVAGVHGSALKLKVQAPPTDGRANRAVERFLADLLDVPVADVTITAGARSRHKRIEVAGIGAGDVRSALDRVLTFPAHERG